MVDGRSAIRRGPTRSSASTTASSTRTPTPTQTPMTSSTVISDPLLSHSSFEGSDPLSQFAREELDPLSKMAADEVLKKLLSLFILR